MSRNHALSMQRSACKQMETPPCYDDHAMILPAPFPVSDPVAPDLLLSFRHRDALAQALTSLGRRVVAARRSDGLAQRFVSLGAHVLLVDARDAAIEALTAVESAAAVVSERGQGLIVLLGDAESEMAPAFITAGAHHIIGAPWRDWELAAALLSSDRSRRFEQANAASLLGAWQADLLSGKLSILAATDSPLHALFGKSTMLRQALRTVARDTQKAAFAAMQQLRRGAGHAVVIQSTEDGRWAHHLSCRATILSAQVELLGGNDAAMGFAARDPVTGLPTIDALLNSLQLRTDSVAGKPGGAAVALVEVARLARYNDAAGRAAGDMLLAGVARRLERQLRSDLGQSTIVARADGARFAVLAPPDISAPRLSLELRAAASAMADITPTALSEAPVALRVASGVIAPAQDPRAAFSALARRLSAPRALVNSIDVEAALTGDDLHVLFQPQFAMDGDRLTGAEALVRWQHPRLGEISGGVVFAAAHMAGLERQLSEAVWQRALKAMAAWPAALAHLRVALNITAADVADAQMPASLLAMAADHDITPIRLTVEVTEAAIIEALDDAAAALRRLRAAGVHVALDDFGTGYSGLSWLKRLPIDYIKIDSSFARDAVGAPRDRAVLTGVVALARALDLDVLAEGVETQEQRDLLAIAGCRWFQGHLRAPALGDAAFVALALAAV